MLAAAYDEVSRQRCIRILQAASADVLFPHFQDIASAAALTRNLLNMQNLSAVNAVLAALGKGAVQGLDASSLKAAGWDAAACAAAGNNWADIKRAGFSAVEVKAAGCNIASAKSSGYDAPSLVSAFGFDAVAATECDMSFILVSCAAALLHAHPCALAFTSITPPPFQYLPFSAMTSTCT